VSQLGLIVGTPAFMASEQARGEGVDHRADLFSLGCVLYWLCTSQLPFKGTDVLSTLTALATEHPEPPKAISLDVPSGLSDLIMDLLNKDPGTPAGVQPGRGRYVSRHRPGPQGCSCGPDRGRSLKRVDELGPERRKIIFDPVPRVDGIESMRPLTVSKQAKYAIASCQTPASRTPSATKRVLKSVCFWAVAE
jgi:serine/threonine protein kinase